MHELYMGQVHACVTMNNQAMLHKADEGKARTSQGAVQACECDLDSDMLRLELDRGQCRLV